MTIFGELDYRMSVVKRWGVVQTIRTQNLAEHSFNVAVITDRIVTRLNRKFRDDPPLDNLAAIRYALHHDRKESITGDFPSYAKVFVNEEGIVSRVPKYEDADFEDDGPGPRIKFVVKCADYIDACVFLRMEISLGNRSVTYHLRHLEARFRAFLAEAQAELTPDYAVVYDWYKEDILDGLFGGNGQYVSEIDGFPK